MLSQAQLGFFARNGFLHLENHIAPEICANLVDHTWTRFPTDWRRDDPTTWGVAGAVEDSCHVSDLKLRRGFLKFQKGDLKNNPFITDNFGPHSSAADLAKSLLGVGAVSMRLRGLYAIVPMPQSVQYNDAIRPHIEAHPSQLIAMHYLEDVVPGGGGLHIWPGSHREIYPSLGSKLEHVSTPGYERIFEEWSARAPVEVPGKRGDVVIIHHRLLHAPGLNRSRNIRYGFLCDYQRKDFAVLAQQAPSGNLWEDWPAIAELPAQLRDGNSDYDLKSRESTVDSRPVFSADLPVSTLNKLSVDASVTRKSDASMFARARQVGDIWVQISDSRDILNQKEVYPRGGRLGDTGLRVLVNGVEQKSKCRFDFAFCLGGAETGGRLSVQGPAFHWRRALQLVGMRGRPRRHEPSIHQLTILGANKPLWVKVFRVALPFNRSEFLLQARVDRARSRLVFSDGSQADAARIAAG